MDAALDLSRKRILITGAGGFLGAHLARKFVQIGCEVHGVSRRDHKREDTGFRWWQADLTDIATVRKLFMSIKPHVIIHLGGMVTASPEIQLVLPTFQSLLLSTINILTSATELDCGRVLLAGSLTEPFPDDVDPTPSSPYAAAKWASNAYGRMFHKLYGTSVVELRPFMTYGPEQNAQKLIPYVIHALFEGKVPKLSGGDWQADWIYVDDVIDGFVAAAGLPGLEGRSIDLGSGTLTPVKAIVDLIVKLVESDTKPEFGAIPNRPGEPVRVANIGYAHQKLGWTPTTSLDEGLRRTVSWYRERISSSCSTKP